MLCTSVHLSLNRDLRKTKKNTSEILPTNQMQRSFEQTLDDVEFAFEEDVFCISLDLDCVTVELSITTKYHISALEEAL